MVLRMANLAACAICVVRVDESSKVQFRVVCQRYRNVIVIVMVIGTGGVASTSPVLKLRPLCRVVFVD